MTKRQVLNVSSTKKRDTMLGSAGPNSGTGGTLGGYDITAQPENPVAFLWTATARDRSSVSNDATRQATTCYMKGLSEQLRLETSNGTMWKWRRITFCAKFGPNSIIQYSGSGGVQRAIMPISKSTVAADVTLWNNIRARLFRGEPGTDWYNEMLAPIDTTRVDLKYDRTRFIRSGNASAAAIAPRLYHPMNKNLVYEDDESGAVTSTAKTSVLDKRGMGDYHVLDLFESVGSDTTGTLTFDANATLYWHEK